MNLRRLAPTLAAATLLLSQACSSTPATNPSPSRTSAGVGGVSPRPLEVTVTLATTTVKAGTSLHGTLTLTNTTGTTLRVECGLRWAVGLASARVPFRPAFTLECRRNGDVKPGATRYPVTLLTTYVFCSQSGRQDGDAPGCLPGPMGAGSPYTVAPPLPTGTYTTSVVVSGLPSGDVLLPQPITVTVT